MLFKNVFSICFSPGTCEEILLMRRDPRRLERKAPFLSEGDPCAQLPLRIFLFLICSLSFFPSFCFCAKYSYLVLPRLLRVHRASLSLFLFFARKLQLVKGAKLSSSFVLAFSRAKQLLRRRRKRGLLEEIMKLHLAHARDCPPTQRLFSDLFFFFFLDFSTSRENKRKKKQREKLEAEDERLVCTGKRKKDRKRRARKQER